MSQPRIGILGGGQLAQMLGESAYELQVETALYTSDTEAPAIQACDESFIGPFKEKPLKAFFEQVPVVAFENEFLDCQLLERAAQGTGVRFLPPLSSIEILQDKLRQKELLVHLEIPTAPFVPLASQDPVEKQIEQAVATLGPRIVFKWARQGYDGHGVFLADFAPTDGRAPTTAALLEPFLARAAERQIPVYAEKRVEFRRELAIVSVLGLNGVLGAKNVAGRANGDFVHYPLVITEQNHGICSMVVGPATSLGVEPQLEQEARRSAEQLARAVGLVGAFAIEFFEDASGTLLVNEIAPRVHNSGHYSQDAARASQFENHVRAVAGLELVEPETRPVFAMLNLIGPHGVTCRPSELPPDPPEGLVLHWYGKSEIRPRRKVGHVNAAGDSPNEISGLQFKLNLYLEEWTQWAQSQQ